MTITSSIQLSDNAFGTLASGLATGDTALSFTTGHGARFATVAAGQALNCCILNANNILEEVIITAHTAASDSATISRAANGTTAKVWNAGDRIEARVSSQVLQRVQQEAMSETTIATADSGATYTGTMSPVALAYIKGVIYTLTLVTSNSGAAPTIALNGLAAITVKLDGGGALTAGQMPLNGIYKYDGTNLILMNPLNTNFSTGDVKITLKTTADTGWVMMDDGTIGDASSGGTTRANSDTSALFALLWNNTVDGDCPVSSGRGASAVIDFGAHKTITLPKSLGRALAVSGAGSGLTSRALAHALGDENLQAHTHTGAESSDQNLIGGSSTAYVRLISSSTVTNTGSTGAGSAQNMQPSVFLNVMVKL